MSNHKCPVDSCSKTFSHSQNLSRHKKAEHTNLVRKYTIGKVDNDKEVDADLTDRACHVICGECNAEMKQQCGLLQHLKKEHGRSDIKVETQSFESQEKFTKWRNEIEHNNTVRFFAARPPAPRDGGGWSTQYLYCTRSGACDRQGTGARAERISVKSGYRCSSYVTAKTFQDGHVEAEYCLQHSGHVLDAAKLTLEETSRELIASYIKDNQTTQWIIDKLNKLYANSNDRNFFVNRKDVANVRHKYQLHRGRLHENDMQSVAEWIRRDKKSTPESGEWENLFAYRPAVDSSGNLKAVVLNIGSEIYLL